MSALSDSGREREQVEEYYDVLYRYGVNDRLHPRASPQALADAQGAQIEENWWRRRLAVWTAAVVEAYRREPLPWRSKDPEAGGSPFDVPDYYDMLYDTRLQVAREWRNYEFVADAVGLKAEEAWWRMRLAPWMSAVVSAHRNDLLAQYRENHPAKGGGEAT